MLKFGRIFTVLAPLLAILISPFNASASSTLVESESEWFFTIQETSTVYIYGNSNADCNEVLADPYLWLYGLESMLIAQDDDSNHGPGQCVSSKIVVDLEPGDYTIRAGYCCQQLGLGETPEWGNGVYELVIVDYALEPTTTTSTTTTTTTTLPVPETTTTTTTSSVPVETTITTSTTTEPPTTTTEPPTTTTEAPTTTTESPVWTTTTTQTPTTTVVVTTPPVPATTTPEPSTTSTTSSTTSSTTTTTTTTIPATTTTVETTTTTISTTTTEPVATTTTEPVATTTTTTVPISTPIEEPTAIESLESMAVDEAVEAVLTVDYETLTDDQAEQLVSALNDAPKEVKQAFESQVDLFSGQFDNYVPVDSLIPVGQRRVVIAVTAVTGIVASAPTTRKRVK